MFHSMCHGDFFNSGMYTFSAFSFWHLLVCQRKFHILIDCQIADKIKTLKNKSNFPVSDACPLRCRKVGNGIVVEIIVSLRRRIRQAEYGQQCGLTTSGRTGYCNIFTFVDFQVYAGKSMGFDFFSYKYLFKVFNFN